MVVNRGLTEKQLKAIHLLVHKALPKDEVAKKLGVSVSTIYAWLNRNEIFAERYMAEKTQYDVQKMILWSVRLKTKVKNLTKCCTATSLAIKQ